MSIRDILIPQDKKFFESFSSQATNILLASQKLSAAFNTGKLSIEDARKEIKQIEHNNDQIVHSIYDRLNQSFITPIDSNDILKLSSDYDTIIDYIYATINKFYLYKIKSPDEWMKRFSEIVLRSAEEIVKLTSAMGKLGRGKDTGDSAQEIDRLENEADDVLNDAVATLFENKVDPIDVIKLKEIYEYLEEITDKYEDAALLIRDIQLRYG
jgi:uncharacterized protein